MISGADFKKQVASTSETFKTQKAKTEGGKGNLVVDGAGKGKITTEADETVVLIAEGDDFVEAKSDFNQIETKAGNNQINVTGGGNSVYTDHGNNNIHTTGNANFIHTNNGNNTVVSIGDAGGIDVKNGNNDITSIGAAVTIEMKNGNNRLASVGSDNKIYADNGNNDINSFGNRNEIHTNHGDNQIKSGGDSNLIETDNGNNKIYSGGYSRNNQGEYSIVGDGNNNVIRTGKGNDQIHSQGNNNKISGGDGDDVIFSTGNNNTIDGQNGNDYINTKGDGNTILGGNGNDIVISLGKKNTIDGQNGNDTILSIGDYNNIGGGDGNNSIVFKGNHLNVSAGNGDNYIATLDFAIRESSQGSLYDDYVGYLDDQINIRTDKHILIDSNTTQEVVGTSTSTSAKTANSSVLDKLSAEDKKVLDSVDFNAKTKNGEPKYVIAQGKKDGEYHIYEHKSGDTYTAVAGFKDNGKRDYDKVSKGNGYLYTNGKTTQEQQAVTYSQTVTTTTDTRSVTTNTYIDRETTVITGVQDVKITTGNGNNNMKLNVSKDLTINAGNGNNNILATGEILVGTADVNRRTETVYGAVHSTSTSKTETSQTATTVVGGKYKTGSPLIVDFNKDGQISAKSGMGVDVDNNGYADGAATGGDKMLAMSDKNGNGVIDGGEVFGDQTISPFTGEKLNAANGFEALRMVAEEATANTGIQCIKDGEVDLKQLQAALKTVGINLGFISDDNITELEDLEHVASINVTEYTEQDASGDVQHRQLGSYTDADGTKYKTDDVWFKLYGKE